MLFTRPSNYMLYTNACLLAAYLTQRMVAMKRNEYRLMLRTAVHAVRRVSSNKQFTTVLLFKARIR